MTLSFLHRQRRSPVRRIYTTLLFFVSLVNVPGYAQNHRELDIAAFGVLTSWSVDDHTLGIPVTLENFTTGQAVHQEWNIGVLWREPRDVQTIRLLHQRPLADEQIRKIKIQYWSSSWPDEPPHLPSMEDQEDDPWQGHWLTAETVVTNHADTLAFRIQPLTVRENPQASFLPFAADYRRTLKIRVLYPSKPSPLHSLQIYSATVVKKLDLRVQLGCTQTKSTTVACSLKVWNGRLLQLQPWQWQASDRFNDRTSFTCTLGQAEKGVLVELDAADPAWPGSTDHTIMTVQLGDAAFSFYTRDLAHNPIYIPAFDAYITLAADTTRFCITGVKKGMTVREKIQLEPEQTFSRSRAEIPALDPVVRDKKGIGDRLYLPLCAEAHWQKFGLEWGGNFFMNKKYVRAKGKDLARCQWPGDTLHWQIGSGAHPDFNRDPANCHMSILQDYLPVVYSRWTHEGFAFEEEAFATLLDAPLAPEGAHRDEQAAALLMIKLCIVNPSDSLRSVDLWLKSDPLDQLTVEHNVICQKVRDRRYIRMFLRCPAGLVPVLTDLPDNTVGAQAFHFNIAIPANDRCELVLMTPFVSDLQGDKALRLAATDYEKEKARVIEYWRERIRPQVVFNVPEEKFNELARAILIHLYMSVWKEPGSGLYMVPAAALRYQIYANESCFQIMLLDLLGAHKNAEDYLETFIKLQGSKPLPGAFVGPQDAVYFGAFIDDPYDYTATGYNLHHGTVLWTLARHYLLTRNNSWLQHAAPSMLRAADWIIAQRQIDKPLFAKGLLPAGRLEDNKEWNYWFSVNTYAWLGLQTTAQAFALAGLPEADRLTQEAAAFYLDLRQAVVSATQHCPVVQLRDQTYSPFVPTAAGRRFRGFNVKSDYYRRYDNTIKPMLRLSATREILYGPMILINNGVVGAEEPMAEWILNDWEDNLTLSSSLGLSVHGWVEDEKWFSQGGMVFQANLQNPIQAYLLRREVPAALRSLYNNMTACLHEDVNVFTEEYRTWVHGSGPFYKTPDEARFLQRVCELLVLEHKKQLWLACGTPRRWLEPGNRIELNKAATVFGCVSYQIQPEEQSKAIVANISTEFWEKPERLALYIRAPYANKMSRVIINGEEWRQWDAEQEVIYLDPAVARQTVCVEYQVRTEE
jgi:hypothetical protein